MEAEHGQILEVNKSTLSPDAGVLFRVLGLSAFWEDPPNRGGSPLCKVIHHYWTVRKFSFAVNQKLLSQNGRM